MGDNSSWKRPGEACCVFCNAMAAGRWPLTTGRCCGVALGWDPVAITGRGLHGGPVVGYGHQGGWSVRKAVRLRCLFMMD